VRDEDDEQAISLTRNEGLAHGREVEHAAAAAGLNADLARLHGASLLWPLAAENDEIAGVRVSDARSAERHAQPAEACCEASRVLRQVIVIVPERHDVILPGDSCAR
jgi:hypothetical protein